MVIVPSPCASAMVTALVELDRSTVNVSSVSSFTSPFTVTLIVCVSPAVPAKFSVPLAAT